MPSDRQSFEVDLIRETTPPLPQNRTGRCCELLPSALALADDLIAQQKMAPAAIMGHKGGAPRPLRERATISSQEQSYVDHFATSGMASAQARQSVVEIQSARLLWRDCGELKTGL